MIQDKVRSEKLTREFKEHIDGFRRYIYRTSASIEVTGIEHSHEKKEKVLMLVSTHRSHLDYLLLGAELETAGVYGIRFAAGDNLTRLPYLGNRFRKMGAFSVYRSKASQRSYLFKLVDQVKKMIEKRDFLIVFPEGGRSYNGHMMEIKGGILGAAVVVQQENPEHEICFLPASISYEIPCEAPYFRYVLKGKKMRDEGKNRLEKIAGELLYYAADIVPFVIRGIRARLGQRFGKIYLDFGAPIPVNQMADVQALYRAKAPNGFLANSEAIKRCSEKIREQFVRMYRIMPSNIVAYALQKTPGLACSQCESQINEIVDQLTALGATFSSQKRGKELFVEGARLLVRNTVGSFDGDTLRIKRPDLLSFFSATVEDRLQGE